MITLRWYMDEKTSEALKQRTEERQANDSTEPSETLLDGLNYQPSWKHVPRTTLVVERLNGHYGPTRKRA